MQKYWTAIALFILFMFLYVSTKQRSTVETKEGDILSGFCYTDQGWETEEKVAGGRYCSVGWTEAYGIHLPTSKHFRFCTIY